MFSLGASATTFTPPSLAKPPTWVSLRASFFLRFDSPSKFAVETQTTPSGWELSISTTSAGNSWSAEILRTSPTCTSDHSFSFSDPSGLSVLAFWLLICVSAFPRCRSSSRAITAVTIIIAASVATVEKALIVPMNSVVCSPSHISKEMTVKYWFPNFMYCSMRFLGTNVSHVYFVVETLLSGKPGLLLKQAISRFASAMTCWGAIVRELSRIIHRRAWCIEPSYECSSRTRQLAAMSSST
mmetsp:Transcript_51619/g.136350  ORF Transcript_51619/g.136350 Transcript_51619/m.136350 type:complete len:241 (+) Transcript_51619:3953-4675(+)